ncbi:insulinase family protein [Schnuerera sp. xch1]|uniref:insulinase family protein n=1 Tax=Schnuerera sp. xch1 TaxID=2874283 RepID=UPI001CC0ED8C|nr:insulinase family protein [Schnuerera sp. xch1]MBZ2174692.1 insulinase family protein [Schnuerera sp. xch1]
MDFEINKTYHGFNLVDEREIKEIQSTARIFHHEKTGAKLLSLENDDNNKVFSIGFRTPPSDNTGVPHIIEHCVLSGSRKYTTKEPFMDMAKGSLQTFLNAMTFSDKTLFPVASRNEKDFFNLMDVYLDAVLYPKIYEKPEIFMQEGWHHEIFDENEKIRYKGVVYNEMQGAYSSPERILSENIDKSLYPDTCYRYSSGGNPDIIPELTYEAFLNFHKKHYHPSNSYIYLYGNGDIKKQLKHIDENYLSNFDKTEVDSNIKMQKPFTSKKEVVAYYPISADESEQNRSYLSLNFVLGKNTDSETYLMTNILGQLLIESAAAPLKKALIDNEIGQDIFSITTGGLQPGFGIVAKNVSQDKKEEFQQVVFDTLNKITKEGIDKELIKACINIIEYDLREASGFASKGITYNILSLDSWLYDGDPVTHIQYEDSISKLKSKVDTDYFEKFIQEHIINNPHSSLVIINPKKGLGEEKERLVEEKLNKYKKSLSEEEIHSLIDNNNKLREMQVTDDSPEDKSTIPKLSISDVNPKAEVIPQEVIKEKTFTLLNHDIFTSKIAYVDFYFDTSIIDKELIPYINLLSRILGEIDTKNKPYSQLSNDIYVNTGGINFQANAYVEKDNADIYYPKFIVKGKAIRDNIPKLMELISELITESKIEDKKRIKELFQQMKSRIEMSIFNNGHSVAARRVGSYYTSSSKYSEQLQGLDFYWFLSDIINNFDSNSKEILSNLNKVYNTIFNVNNLIVSFTGDADDFKLMRDNLPVVIDKLNIDRFEPKEYSFTKEKLNEGILSSANVQYVSKGYNFKKLGYSYNGSLAVLSTLLSREYLHNKIRAQGGAYGAGINIDRTGHVTTYSYRDPNLKDTVNAYDNMVNYIENLNMNDSELTTFIIGTISRLEPAMTPHAKGQTATNRYISNVTQEDIQTNREEVLNTQLKDIKKFATLLKDTMEKNYLCVLGNENKLRQNKHLFTNLVKLKK